MLTILKEVKMTELNIKFKDIRLNVNLYEEHIFTYVNTIIIILHLYSTRLFILLWIIINYYQSVVEVLDNITKILYSKMQSNF